MFQLVTIPGDLKYFAFNTATKGFLLWYSYLDNEYMKQLDTIAEAHQLLKMIKFPPEYALYSFDELFPTPLLEGVDLFERTKQDLVVVQKELAKVKKELNPVKEDYDRLRAANDPERKAALDKYMSVGDRLGHLENIIPKLRQVLF
jgi:hypothetical protein